MRAAERMLGVLPLLLLLASCADKADETYQRSIATAAVKRPDYAHTLRPIDISKPTVTVAHVQPYPTIDPKRFTWIALPDELRALCKGKANPLLAIEQALGLPPTTDPNIRVFTFDVSHKAVFRPCASSPSITTTQCGFDTPAKPTPAETSAEQFVLAQMMASYQVGFTNNNGTEAFGYPFTGMGWSYNWDPQSPTHHGVSEYVVRPNAAMSNIKSADPATFCQ